MNIFINAYSPQGKELLNKKGVLQDSQWLLGAPLTPFSVHALWNSKPVTLPQGVDPIEEGLS